MYICIYVYYIYIYMYICIYTYVYMCCLSTTYPPGHHHNGFKVTDALWYMVYMLFVCNNLKSVQVTGRERIITIINDHFLRLKIILPKSPEVQRSKS